MNALDPRLVVSGRLIEENHQLFGEAEVKRVEYIACLWRPWRWARLARLDREFNALIAQIKANADRIDMLHAELEESLGT